MRGMYQWSQGIVVLYSANCVNLAQRGSTQPIFGHKVIKRSRNRWEPSTMDVYATNPNPAADRLVEYSISKSLAQGDRHVAVYGQALAPNVVAMEATFDNGQILRKRVVKGVFAIVAPGAKGACELRAIGSDNQVLKRYDLSPLYELSSKHQQWSAQCLPFTLQL